MPIIKSTGESTLWVSPANNGVAGDEKAAVLQHFSTVVSAAPTTVAFVCNPKAFDLATQLLALPNSPTALTISGLPNSMSARWPLFLEGLRSKKRITGLNFNYGGMDTKGLDVLNDVLPTLPLLQTLEMRSSGVLNASSIEMFAPRMAALSVIDLSRNPLGDAGANVVTRTITKVVVNVRVLVMSECGMGDEAMPGFRDVLTINTLRTLDVAGNRITDKGVAALAPALQAASGLQVLDLGRNSTTAASDRTLITAVTKPDNHPSLITLWIGNQNSPPTDLVDILNGNIARLHGRLSEEYDYREECESKGLSLTTMMIALTTVFGMGVIPKELIRLMAIFLAPVEAPCINNLTTDSTELTDSLSWRGHGNQCREVVTNYRFDHKFEHLQTALTLRAVSDELDWQYRRTAINAVNNFYEAPPYPFTAAPAEMMMEMGLAAIPTPADLTVALPLSQPSSASSSPRDDSSTASTPTAATAVALSRATSNESHGNSAAVSREPSPPLPTAAAKEIPREDLKRLHDCKMAAYNLGKEYRDGKSFADLESRTSELMVSFNVEAAKTISFMPLIRQHFDSDATDFQDFIKRAVELGKKGIESLKKVIPALSGSSPVHSGDTKKEDDVFQKYLKKITPKTGPNSPLSSPSFGKKKNSPPPPSSTAATTAAAIAATAAATPPPNKGDALLKQLSLF